MSKINLRKGRRRWNQVGLESKSEALLGKESSGKRNEVGPTYVQAPRLWLHNSSLLIFPRTYV